MNLEFKKYLLAVTSSNDCNEIEIIQSLWSGYGKISRYQLINSLYDSVVVKHISLNQFQEHPRGWSSNYSHDRKVKSYQVETYWYEKWSELCHESCRIPKFLGSFSQAKNQWIILEDLKEVYPLRKYELNFNEVKVCLKWLANFHVTFLKQNPTGLWEVGTYWHLNTRPDEFEKIGHLKLKAKAHLIDEVLNQCQFQTIVHGDAKLANFCFSQDGQKIAAVDFQYVGGGCGMKDVAYFLGSCLSSSECERHENSLLNYYFSEFEDALGSSLLDVDFKTLESEWRYLYPFACSDFMRFMLGWMPSHQKIDNYNLKMVTSVLVSLAEK